MDLDYAVFSIISPMVFLMLAKHSAVTWTRDAATMNPEKFIAAQLQIILYGMGADSADRQPANKPKA